MHNHHVRNQLANVKTINTILSILMILALFNLPYFYYELLRVVVFLGAAYDAYVAYTLYDKANGPFYVFLFIALLWNPIFPIYLTRGVWNIFNVIAAIVFFFLRPDPNIADHF
jgi:hypothetical protein